MSRMAYPQRGVTAPEGAPVAEAGRGGLPADGLVHLLDILGSSDVTLIVLDSELRVQLFTPQAARLFPLVAQDIGRSILSLSVLSIDRHLWSDCRILLGGGTAPARDIQNGDTSYLRRARVYRSEGIEGIVVTFSALGPAAGLVHARAAQEYVDRVLATIRRPLVILDRELRILSVNPAAAKILVSLEQSSRTAESRGRGEATQKCLLTRLVEAVPWEAVAPTLDDYQVALDADADSRTLVVHARQIRTMFNEVRLLLELDDVTEIHRERATLRSATAELLAATHSHLQFVSTSVLRFCNAFDGAFAQLQELMQRLQEPDMLSVVPKLLEPLQSLTRALEELKSAVRAPTARSSLAEAGYPTDEARASLGLGLDWAGARPINSGRPCGARNVPAISRAPASAGSARLPDVTARLSRLSRREREILDRVLAGRSNKVIAADLGISQRTVEFHRAAVMRKTGSKSFLELIRLALAAAP